MTEHDPTNDESERLLQNAALDIQATRFYDDAMVSIMNLYGLEDDDQYTAADRIAVIKPKLKDLQDLINLLIKFSERKERGDYEL